uniref:Uncharacterized protein n=1 Tax=Caenorhabditis japonica TaxID=281687 RepID=A0A8R1HLE4_CAEJA
MRLHDGDSFKDKAICQRGEYDNRCACSTTDHCNDPKVKINSYVFTQNPVLEGYQWLPQIQPPMPPLQPVLPPVELPVPLENDHDMNETVAELESGVETDLLNDLDNETWIPRKDEKHEENLLTVTTTVGLNVRDHTSRVNNSIGQHLESTTGKSFTAGQGSVEVTKVTQEATPMQSPPKNRTSDGTDPNSTGTSQFFFALALPVL